ncbi:MAG: enoyl-CoA hydratase/isomerase family protein [Desulfobacterales bacterium]|nr:enoyl-CoA hydratase/isomerase family protein [Desulfobacterales bacterium]
MKGPMKWMDSKKIPGLENRGPFYEWREGETSLLINEVGFKGKSGVILHYSNPPVHQVGNPGLGAYLEGLGKVLEKRESLEFLILYGANDPVHAGGDLKESLANLDRTLEHAREMKRAGASQGEIDGLFEWADSRLRKGMALHAKVREIARTLRVVAVCGGGMRFGGSAEIPLMADFLVGDSRSGMCFSEAMLGLIPGWSGVARTLVKAGPTNAAYMAMTSKEVKAAQLREIGIYHVVVDVPFSFPKRQKTDDLEADKAAYLEDLEAHDEKTGLLLIPEGLKLATCPLDQIPQVKEHLRPTIATKEEITREVERRRDPETYSRLWGRPLREVKEEIAEKGRPLAPQSIEALKGLLDGYDPSSFDEQAFVQQEGAADARLYRDSRFRAGVVATLEQRVADYR